MQATVGLATRSCSSINALALQDQLQGRKASSQLLPFFLPSVTYTSNTRCHSLIATVLYNHTKQARENIQNRKHLYSSLLSEYLKKKKKQFIQTRCQHQCGNIVKGDVFCSNITTRSLVTVNVLSLSLGVLSSIIL